MEKKSAPLIIAMKGHPGTGKSTLSRALAGALRIPLLDKDDIRDQTLPIQTLTLIDPTLLNDLSYSALFRLARTQLHLGLSLVIDSPLSRPVHLDRLRSLASGSAARLKVVECRAGDEAEWRRRIEARRGGENGEGWHKPRSWGELRKLVEGYEGGTDYEFGDVERIVVDTTAEGGTVEGLVEKVLEFLSEDFGG